MGPVSLLGFLYAEPERAERNDLKQIHSHDCGKQVLVPEKLPEHGMSSCPNCYNRCDGGIRGKGERFKQTAFSSLAPIAVAGANRNYAFLVFKLALACVMRASSVFVAWARLFCSKKALACSLILL